MRSFSESSPSPRPLSLLLSVAVHAAGIAAGVAHMKGPHFDKAKPAVEHIVRVQLAAKPPAPKADERRDESARLRRPRGFQVLVAPAEIPTSLPAITLAAPIREEDFSGRGVEGGTADGLGTLPMVVRRTAGGEPYDEELVDRRPYMLDAQFGPAYPDELRRDALDGLVLIRFVLDTTGRIEPGTARIVSSTNPAFTESVRAVLDGLRYSPAWMDGRKVRARVEQRFEFHLAR